MDIKPTYKQHIAYEYLKDDTTRFLLFGGGAGPGKSWLGCEWLLMVCHMHPGTRWFIGREELKRLRASTLITMFKVLKHHDVALNTYNYNGQDHYISFSNGSRIDLLDLKFLPSDPLYERYGSVEYTGGWIEEGGEVAFEAFDTLKSRIGRHLNKELGILGKMLITCNPKKNWLYDKFYQPFKEGTLHHEYAFVRALVTDNFFIDERYIENLKQIDNEAQRQRLLHGNWDYADDPDQLIFYEWILEALNRSKDMNLYKPGVKLLGTDVGGDGENPDDSTISIIDGNLIRPIEYIKGKRTDQIADRVEQLIKINPVNAEDARIDTVGLGAGVWDALARRRIRCTKFIAGAKPIIENDSPWQFKNLRSQMWWHLREWFKNGDPKVGYPIMLEKDEKLISDLTAIHYKIANEKVIQVESKSDIKKRLGRSTDPGDALMMAKAKLATFSFSFGDESDEDLTTDSTELDILTKNGNSVSNSDRPKGNLGVDDIDEIGYSLDEVLANYRGF